MYRPDHASLSGTVRQDFGCYRAHSSRGSSLHEERVWCLIVHSVHRVPSYIKEAPLFRLTAHRTEPFFDSIIDPFLKSKQNATTFRHDFLESFFVIEDTVHRFGGASGSDHVWEAARW